MSKIVDIIKSRACENIKTIVLAEGEDERVIEAAYMAVNEGFAEIILLGSSKIIKEKAYGKRLDIKNINIIDPADDIHRMNVYADRLYNIRKRNGMTEEEAVHLCRTPLYYGAMMVECGDADGMVCGAVTSSADVMRAALRVIKTAPDTRLVSTTFLMCVNQDGEEKVFAFADCVVNVDPNPQELSEIAISTAKTFSDFTGDEPRVAMLSYSTYGIDTDVVIHKMQEAAYIVKRRCPELKVDGEMQLDAAIDESVARRKIKNLSVGGRANVLIFPDLNAGNISYKIVQRLCGGEVVGPIMQGLAKPVNDLSRGCDAEEIANVIAITAIQAANIQNKKTAHI